MALGTPVDGGAAYSASGGTSVAPSYPAGIGVGDCLVLIVGQKPGTANGGTVTTPSGWTLQGELTAAGGYGTTLGADTGNTNLRFYTKNTVTGSETGTLSVALGGNGVSWAVIVNVPTDGGTLSFAQAEGQQSTTPTSSLSVTLSPNISAQAGDKFVTAMCIPTDVTTPNQFTNAGVTITGLTETDTELEEPDSTTGNDIGGFVGVSHVNSGTATGAPVFTATLAGTLTNVRGPVVTLRIRETLAARTGDLDATETGSDSFESTGDVKVQGSLSATEAGNDTFAATGTVTDAGITGTLAATETGSDTFTSTAKLIVKGSLSATEVGSDTFAATGKLVVQGSLSVTETGSDSFAASGKVVVKGSLSATETGSDTFAASGVVFTPGVSGTLAAQETGADSFASSGTVFYAARTGDLAATETGADALAASGKVTVQGSVSGQETGQDVFAATATAPQVRSGSMSATETGADTVGLYVDSGYVNPGYVQQAIYGSVLVEGSLSASETGSDRASFLGVQPVQEDVGGGRKNYFRPVREVTVRVGVSQKLSANTRAVKVNVTSQTVALGWAPGARINTKPVHIYRSVQPEVKGRVSGGTRSVLVATDFNLKALPVTMGFMGHTSSVSVTTSEAQIVLAKTPSAKFGSSPATVKAVINPTDDELLAIAAALKQARMRQMQSIVSKFRR